MAIVDPITIGSLGVLAFGGFVANRGDRFACQALDKVRRSFLSGLREPRNHDLARAIRRSQLLALKLVVKAYKDLTHPRPLNFPGYSPEDIATPLWQWINNGIIFEPTLEADLKALPDIDKQAWNARLRTIEAQIERVFTHPQPHEGTFLARQEELRELAEDWTLDEIEPYLRDRKDRARFENLLRGMPIEDGDGKTVEFAGWWRLFRAFMAEEIKSDDKVRAILAQQGISEMLELQQDLAVAVDVLQGGLETLMAELRAGFAELRSALARVERSEAEIAAALGVIDTEIGKISLQLIAIARKFDELPGRIEERIEASQRAWHGIAVNPGTKDYRGVADKIRNRPSEVLIARYGIVPYLDFGGVREELLAWARDPAVPGPRGRLYKASGGFGKTRLAIETIKALGPGWRATFLSSGNTRSLSPGALSDLMTACDGEGLFLVLDYAEGQISLLDAVAEAAAHAPTRIRVLALARSAAGWWQGAHDRAAIGDMFERIPRTGLGSSLSMADRKALHESAARAFHDTFLELGIQKGDGTAPIFDLSDRLLERPLGVLMAAYLAARGAESLDVSLFDTMLAEERKLWKRRIAAVSGRSATEIVDDDPQVISLHRLLAQITLVQSATTGGAEALSRADPRALELGREAREMTLATARTLHGVTWYREDGEPIAGIAPVEPDILGEHVAMAALAADRDGLVAGTLDAALTNPALFSSDAASILTVLERSHRQEHDLSTRKAAATALAAIENRVSSMDRDALNHLNDQLPDYSTPLIWVSLAVAQRMVEINEALAAAEPARYRPDLGASLNTYAIRLSATGDARAALEPARRAVEIYEALADAEPARYRPNLAISLSKYTTFRSETGDARGALGPARYRPHLAMSLNNYANSLSETGDARAALEPARRAIEIYEALVAAQPARYRPNLATSLNNYATFLSETGDARAALEPARRAIEIREQLAAAEPARYRPDLAASLSNYALNLSETGDARAALEPARRAIEIREQLAAAEPARYRPDLAASLSNYALNLSETGDARAALEPARRAIEIREQLAAAEPARYRPDLAASLNNYANSLSETGDARAALEPARRAIEIREQLAAAEPARYRPDLATSLYNYANSLGKTGDARAALEPARRAVEIREELATTEPARYRPDLAASLNNYANRLSETGDARAALGPARRAVETYEDLAAAEPARYRPDLARSYCSQGVILSANGMEEDAGMSFEKGIVAIKANAADIPAAFATLFLDLLDYFVRSLRSTDTPDEEVGQRLEALDLDMSLISGGGQPPVVRYYQDWFSAGQADDLPAASLAYTQLVAALDAELEDRGLDPIRYAVFHMHDQFGEDWPFGPLPNQPD